MNKSDYNDVPTLNNNNKPILSVWLKKVWINLSKQKYKCYTKDPNKQSPKTTTLCMPPLT